MMPRLGKTYNIDIEVMERPKEEYMTNEYFELDLLGAPVVMVSDEIVAEGTDVSEEQLEAVICRHLSLAPPAGKDLLSKIFK